MKTKNPEVIEFVRIKPKKAGAKIRDLAPKKDVKGGNWRGNFTPKLGAASASNLDRIILELRVYEDGADQWYVGFRDARWALPLSKADAIARAKLRANEKGIREIGVYNQAGELLETLAV